MNHHHQDRRIARSAECSTAGVQFWTEAETMAAVVRARDDHGALLFTKAMLERMPAMARAIVEGEHRRICERSGG